MASLNRPTNWSRAGTTAEGEDTHSDNSESNGAEREAKEEE